MLKTVGLLRNHPSIVMSAVANFIKKSTTLTFNPGMQHWAALFLIYSVFELVY